VGDVENLWNRIVADFRQYECATCRDYGVVFEWQSDVELRPVFRQKVDITLTVR
jgi:hypothetical protein